MLIKLVPDAVNVNDPEPALILLGEMEINVGMGLVPTAEMVKTAELEVPPPGAGVFTEILTVPALTTSELLIFADS